MYSILKTTHSYLAYLGVFTLVAVFFVLLVFSLLKKRFGVIPRTASLAVLAITHIQLLFGLLLYLFWSPLGLKNLGGETMKNSFERLYAIEHPLTMILGVVLITIGYSKAKRKTGDREKYNLILIFYGLAAVLMLSRIPWETWPRF